MLREDYGVASSTLAALCCGVYLYLSRHNVPPAADWVAWVAWGLYTGIVYLLADVIICLLLQTSLPRLLGWLKVLYCPNRSHPVNLEHKDHT